jgi:hypothetical protein
VRRRLFHVQNNRRPWRCHAMTVSGLTITTAVRQPAHVRDNHAQSHRSALARRSRRGWDRWSTCSWWRSARTSRCRTARDRINPRSIASREIRTDIIAIKAYRSPPASSNVPTCTEFLAGTGPHATACCIEPSAASDVSQSLSGLRLVRPQFEQPGERRPRCDDLSDRRRTLSVRIACWSGCLAAISHLCSKMAADSRVSSEPSRHVRPVSQLLCIRRRGGTWTENQDPRQGRFLD